MYQWIKDSFDKGSSVRKSGAISTGDFNFNEKRRTTMSQAFISSVTIPVLDRTSKAGIYIAVNLSSAKLADVPPSGKPVPGAKQKAWLPANFVLELDGVDDEPGREHRLVHVEVRGRGRRIAGARRRVTSASASPRQTCRRGRSWYASMVQRR